MSSNMRIESDFFIIEMDADGRGYHVRLQQYIKRAPHNQALIKYAKKLYSSGVERINADQVTLDFLDRSLSLVRGKRRIDLVYVKNNRLVECEFKTKYECGLDRTYNQLKEQLPHCENLTLLVPRNMIEDVISILKIKKLNRITVDTYE
jgi:hypothetical protein